MSENNKPSLSSLSNARQTPTNSLAQLKQKMQQPSLASLASSSSSSNAKPLSSLQSLAQRANKTSSMPSLASLAQKSTPPKTGGNSLAGLATRTNTPQPTKLGSLTSLASKQTPPPTPPTSVAKPPIVSETKMAHPPKEQIKKEEEEEEEIVENPLIAKPSLAAQFLFQPQQQPKSIPIDDILAKAMKKSLSIQVFQFDQPSPDDIVMSAQSQRGGGNKKN